MYCRHTAISAAYLTNLGFMEIRMLPRHIVVGGVEILVTLPTGGVSMAVWGVCLGDTGARQIRRPYAKHKHGR
jgi:hypothetical protein